jgi:deazaflavin-dependent oxidoreductase (nitroreductase family)
MLLLTTKGRRTGRSHTVPLLYLEEEAGSLIIIASYGGRDHNPEWYLNLSENPEVDVRTRHRRLHARARTAVEEERSMLWSRITAAYQGYEAYQARTDRLIPVIVLEVGAV